MTQIKIEELEATGQLTVGDGNLQLNAGAVILALHAQELRALATRILPSDQVEAWLAPYLSRPDGASSIQIGKVKAQNAVVGSGNVQINLPAGVSVDGAIDALRAVSPTDAVLEASDRLGLLSTTTSQAFERLVRPGGVPLNPGDFRRKLAALERVVGRLELSGRPLGTAFLIGPDLVLTNFHVVMGHSGVGDALGVRFDYRSEGTNDASGTLCPLVSDGSWRVDASPPSAVDGEGGADAPRLEALDYAVLRLSAPIGAATGAEPARGWLPLDAPAPAVPRSPVAILQHPRGSRLKLCFGTLLNVTDDGARLRYDANTEGGSSGSPCFNESLELIALHHMGDPDFDRAPQFNQGIPIALIAKKLKDNGVTLAPPPQGKSAAQQAHGSGPHSSR